MLQACCEVASASSEAAVKEQLAHCRQKRGREVFYCSCGGGSLLGRVSATLLAWGCAR